MLLVDPDVALRHLLRKHLQGELDVFQLIQLLLFLEQLTNCDGVDDKLLTSGLWRGTAAHAHGVQSSTAESLPTGLLVLRTLC